MFAVSSTRLSAAAAGATTSRPLLQLFTGTVPTRAASSEPALAVAEEEDLPTNRPSMTPAGTVLTGLNYIVGEKEFVAMEDDKYPKWLWMLEGQQASKAAQTDPTKRNFYAINRKRDTLQKSKERPV